MNQIANETKLKQHIQKNDQSLISVILPVYNVEQYLPHCFETISQQTYQNLEIIIVDDGSTDNSGKISEDFTKKDNRARVIHQRNKGLYAARNTGQKAAKGDYIIFFDSDDYMHLDMINILYNAINQDGGYDIAIAGFKKTKSIDENITEAGDIHTMSLKQEELIHNFFFGKNKTIYHSVWNKLYRTEIIKDIQSNCYRRTQDTDYNFRVFLKIKKAILIDRVLYFWYQWPGSITHKKTAMSDYYDCITQICYDNLCNLPKDKQQYSHYLLQKLFRKMVNMKNMAWKTEKEQEVFEKCRFYEKKTRKAYWNNSKINFFEKIFVTALLHNNYLTRWLRKITHNC